MRIFSIKDDVERFNIRYRKYYLVYKENRGLQELTERKLRYHRMICDMVTTTLEESAQFLKNAKVKERDILVLSQNEWVR